MNNQKTRILKVEEVGDFYHNKTQPRIRLKGKWLVKAGILPNNHVEIENPQPGVLIVQLVKKDI